MNRPSCRNILIPNVLFMVCGAMAGGGWGGGVASCITLILIIHMTPFGQWQNSNDLPHPPPQSKPRDFCEPPRTIDNEDSLITFDNNNRNRQ